MCPVSYIRDVFSRDKKISLALINSSIGYKSECGNVNSCSILSRALNKRVYPELKENPILKTYFQEYPENIYPERKFFYGVVGSLFPDKLKAIIKKAREHRSIIEASDENELIHFSPEFSDEIMKLLSHPTTPGRAVFLLKQKAKTTRKKRTAKEFMADFKPISSIRMATRRLPVPKEFSIDKLKAKAVIEM
ncbi:unnamed protein product [Moneuplotes crassus]|uniref:Uncharacterized protein n=1 Tax=Euplotes crassus TaxID=5936 RepID=A0AAD1XG55_EUPCR|nr:unnamed protein product [Moneuplotes crassus]